jgi:hypothetical protein
LTGKIPTESQPNHKHMNRATYGNRGKSCQCNYRDDKRVVQQ